MRAALGSITAFLRFPGRFFFWGSLGIVLFSAWVMSTQVSDRWGFANAELHRDVMDRWGAPILQPAPSARYVQSGSVFNALESLPFESQRVVLDADMSYRKRGLVYFSGFEFDFSGLYGITNPESHAIDVVFVFPIHAQRNRILLSDLRFTVNGEEAPIPLDEQSDKLVWTGRLEPEESASFELAFRGQGLDTFTYQLDPSLPVRDFQLDLRIRGGDDEFDYAAGVLPAHSVTKGDGEVALAWRFPSLESGVPVGVILPSETSFDQVIVTMVRRSWATFALFFATVVILAAFLERPLERYESYLFASGYAFFFVLLPYLAAYMDFYAAYVVSCLAIGALLVTYLTGLLSARARPVLLALVAALLVIPTTAVILQEHTGLIYSLEILAGLAVVMWLSTRPGLRDVLRRFEASLASSTPDQETPHVDA